MRGCTIRRVPRRHIAASERFTVNVLLLSLSVILVQSWQVCLCADFSLQFENVFEQTSYRHGAIVLQLTLLTSSRRLVSKCSCPRWSVSTVRFVGQFFGKDMCEYRLAGRVEASPQHRWPLTPRNQAPVFLERPVRRAPDGCRSPHPCIRIRKWRRSGGRPRHLVGHTVPRARQSILVFGGTESELKRFRIREGGGLRQYHRQVSRTPWTPQVPSVVTSMR